MPLVLHSSHRTSRSDIKHKNSEVLPDNLKPHMSCLTIGIPHFAWSIEWCFGVLKVRFPILNDMYSYSQSRQRLIVTACCALHNFIRMYSHSNEMFRAWEGQDLEPGNASISGGARFGGGGNEEAFSPQAQQAMSQFRDEITITMWAEYTNNHS